MEENNKTGNNIQNYFYGNVKTVVYGDCHINEGVVNPDKKKVTDEQKGLAWCLFVARVEVWLLKKPW